MAAALHNEAKRLASASSSLRSPRSNKTLVLELARSEYIAREHHCGGQQRHGKTHVALGLGLAACQKGLAVGFTTATASNPSLSATESACGDSLLNSVKSSPLRLTW
jgi:hypothetical protein